MDCISHWQSYLEHFDYLISLKSVLQISASANDLFVEVVFYCASDKYKHLILKKFESRCNPACLKFAG